MYDGSMNHDDDATVDIRNREEEHAGAGGEAEE
jgi:hypothetical protein